MAKKISVELTLPQADLIIEQMEKGAGAWMEGPFRFNHMALRIAENLRNALIRAEGRKR